MPTAAALLRLPPAPSVPLSASFRALVAGDVGTLTETDTNGVIASSGGALAISGTPAANDGLHSVLLSRRAGRCLLVTLDTLTTIPAGSPVLGWGQNPTSTDGSVDIGLALASTTTAQIKTGTTTIDTVTIGAAPWSLAFIERAGGGGWLLARSGRTGPYTLLWVYNSGTADEYAKLRLAASAINLAVSSFKVIDLGTPWDRPYGPALARAVLPAANVNTLYAHTSDLLLEFSFTYTSGQTTGVAFRTHTPGQSANKWRCYASGGGNLVLDQTVASSSTNRIATAAFTNGVAYRVVVVAESNVYKVFVNDVLKGTYTDAGSFQVAETLSVVDFVGSPISEMVFCPRKIDLPAYLEAA
jgi:hypothetical protein